MSVDGRAEEMAQYYEAAGFADFRERMLDGKTDREVATLHAGYRAMQRDGSPEGEEHYPRLGVSAEQGRLRLLEFRTNHLEEHGADE